MKVLVFFLPLFFLLLFGNVHSFGGNGVGVQHPSALLMIDHSANVENFPARKSYNYFRNLTQSEEYKILICEEVDDQDPDESSNKKDRLNNGFQSVFYRQSSAACYQNCGKVFPFLWRKTSHRYILQRTLRV